VADYRPKCPRHGIPDCSPILNGRSIPNHMHAAYERGRAEQAAADRARIEALRERWETALGERRCPSCHMSPDHDCDHGEGYHHALSDLRAALDPEGGA
jgi:hypothetical protein